MLAILFVCFLFGICLLMLCFLLMGGFESEIIDKESNTPPSTSKAMFKLLLIFVVSLTITCILFFQEVTASRYKELEEIADISSVQAVIKKYSQDNKINYFESLVIGAHMFLANQKHHLDMQKAELEEHKSSFLKEVKKAKD